MVSSVTQPLPTKRSCHRAWLRSGFPQMLLRLLLAVTSGFCTQTCGSYSRGKKQKSASTQQRLNLGRCRKSIKSMTVNPSGLNQQFLNSFCPGTIDMTAGALWGLLQPCISVDLPQDVAWGFAGRTTYRSEGASVAQHVPKAGNRHLRNGWKASVSYTCSDIFQSGYRSCSADLQQDPP